MHPCSGWHSGVRSYVLHAPLVQESNVGIAAANYIDGVFVL